MKQFDRHNVVLPIIEEAIPEATPERKLELSNEFRRFFDAWWAVAERIADEEWASTGERDNSSEFARVEEQEDV